MKNHLSHTSTLTLTLAQCPKGSSFVCICGLKCFWQVKINPTLSFSSPSPCLAVPSSFVSIIHKTLFHSLVIYFVLCLHNSPLLLYLLPPSIPFVCALPHSSSITSPLPPVPLFPSTRPQVHRQIRESGSVSPRSPPCSPSIQMPKPLPQKYFVRLPVRCHLIERKKGRRERGRKETGVTREMLSGFVTVL